MTTSQIIFRSLIGVLASLSLLFFDSLKWTGWLRGSTEAVMKPELSLVMSVRGKAIGVVSSIQFVMGGTARIEDLERKLAIAEQYALQTSDVQQENDALKKLMGSFNFPKNIRTTPARILSRGAKFIIENVHVSPGQAVVSPDGNYVGVIQSVGVWSASVQLPTDSESLFPVSVELPDGTEAEGELHGSFGAAMAVEKILSHVDLSPGLLVVTNGSDGRMPPHLLVGTIGKDIHHDVSAVYQDAVVDPSLHVSALSTVFIIDK